MKRQFANTERGKRFNQAMKMRGHLKAMALAAELGISPAAITKWKQGHAMSVDHACNFASLLDVLLDWLLMDRNSPDWLQPDQLSDTEIELVSMLRQRPERIGRLVITLLHEMRENAQVEESR